MKFQMLRSMKALNCLFQWNHELGVSMKPWNLKIHELGLLHWIHGMFMCYDCFSETITWRVLSILAIFYKTMKGQTLWIQALSRKPWNVKYYKLWTIKCLLNEGSLFQWNHEMSNFMNVVSFDETMKCQTLWMMSLSMKPWNAKS